MAHRERDTATRDVVRIADFPQLRILAWQRHSPEMDARDALALYEANWRFIDQDALLPAERALLERIQNTYGNGVLNV